MHELADVFVRIFGYLGCKIGQIIAVLREVDVEMIGLDELPLKILVLNFVLSEYGILSVGTPHDEAHSCQN
jgi:hypothetical protein